MYDQRGRTAIGRCPAMNGLSTSVPKLSAIHRAKHSGNEHMKSELWVFNDPPNVAAIASKGVLCGRDWIDDEGWRVAISRLSI
jgi:hypothetical protein